MCNCVLRFLFLQYFLSDTYTKQILERENAMAVYVHIKIEKKLPRNFFVRLLCSHNTCSNIQCSS